MIEFKEILTPGQLADVYKAMEDTEHPYIPANVSIHRKGELIGALAVNSVPVVQVFMDPRKADAMDSVRALRRSDELARIYRYQQYLILCPQESPYFKHMERLGFEPKGHSHIFHRRVD